MENWQNQLCEASMLRCARITKSLRWVGTEVCNFLTYEGLPNLDAFINEFQIKILKE